MGAVAEAMIEGLKDQVAFDVGDRLPNQPAGHRFRRDGGLRCRALVAGGDHLVQSAAVGRHQGFRADLVGRIQEHRAMHGVLKLAHVARPFC